MSANVLKIGKFFKAAEALRELPDKEAVADFLRGKGAKGYRNAFDRCPVANYLRDAIGDDAYTTATGTDLGYRWPSTIKEGRYDTVELAASPPLAEFIGDFDTGKYPEFDQIPAPVSA